MRAGDGGAHRVHAGQRRVDEGEHEIEVVDHQIEMTETSVPRGLKGAMRGGVDIERAAHAGGDGVVFGGVADQVADLQDQVAGGGEGGEMVRLVEGGGDGLFDQHVAAGLQRGGREGVVVFGGGGDDHGIDRRQQASSAMGVLRVSRATVAARVESGSCTADQGGAGGGGRFSAWKRPK